MPVRRCAPWVLVVGVLAVAAAPSQARASDPAEAGGAAAEAPAPAASAPAGSVVTARPRRGFGLLGAGVPLGVLGLVGIGIGGAFLFEDLNAVCAAEPCPSAGRGLSFFGASIFFSGLLTFGSGAAMTAVGAVRHHRYRQWRSKQVARSWAPRLARSAHGTWIVGVGLGF